MPVYQNINIDEAYAARFLEAQYTNTWLLPGVTCADATAVSGSVDAGIFNFHKMSASSLGAPEVVGANYTTAQQADTLVSVYLSNQYTESAYLPIAAGNAMKADAKGAIIANQSAAIRTRRQQTAVACLVDGLGFTAGSGTAESFSSHKVFEVLNDAAAAALTAKGNPVDTVLMKPTVYAKLRSELATLYTPGTNDNLIKVGVQNIVFNGMTIVPCADLANAPSAGYKWKKTLTASADVTVSQANLNKVNFLAYNHNDLLVVDNLADFYDAHAQASPSWQISSTMNTGFGLLYTTSLVASVSAAWA